MAQRTDVGIRFDLDPRVFRVDAPSVELVVQDLHDTARDIEDEPNAMQYTETIKTAGKEPLGGGVTVGLTSTLQNMLVAFDPRTASVSGGTATSADSEGSVLTDIGATFQDDGVLAGAVVVNFTDLSVGSVANVLSQTELLLFPIIRGDNRSLDDGATNTWSVNDVYKIWNIEQVNLTGGNVVAIDDLGGDISAILPTFGTQVLQTGSSSATLQELSAVQHSSFDGGVTVDLTLSTTGTVFPLGTSQAPVGNFVDALDIANTRGFSRLYILGNATIDSGLNYTGKRFVGESQTRSLFTITATANVSNAEFSDATIEGELDGGSMFVGCQILNVTFVEGTVEDCVLSGTVTLSGSATAYFVNCISGIPGLSTPVIDCGGSGRSFVLRNYSGGITLRNKSGAEAASIDMLSGQVVLESTVTNGLIVVRGGAKVTNNSTGSAVIQIEPVESAPGLGTIR